MRDLWTRPWRVLVFMLAGTSIGSLLADFYGLGTMRVSTLFIFLPALAALSALSILDFSTGCQRLWQSVLTGVLSGLAAAVAYDLFRLPFVFAPALHIQSVVPSLPLFKVFPRFGAMILGQPIEQPHYSLSAQLIGWTYHFSNGITFGIMYVALVGDPVKRHWAWAILFALGLEIGMLVTPYPGVFAIRVTAVFVSVTLAAHALFGVVLGLSARELAAPLRRSSAL